MARYLFSVSGIVYASGSCPDEAWDEGISAYDAIEARAIAAFYRSRNGAPDIGIVKLEGLTPAKLASAAMTFARKSLPVEAPVETLRDHADASLILVRFDARQDGNRALEVLCDRARVHLSPDFAKLRAAFSHRLAKIHVTRDGRSAILNRGASALMDARRDVAAGRTVPAPRPDYLTHGSVIRTRKPDGSRVTYAIAHVRDNGMGEPWKEHDGHGMIREVSSREDKRPGERLFGSGERHGTIYAYDIAETMKLALRDGWNTNAEFKAELAAKLGREPTARQVAAAAVEIDFRRMRGWTRDEWEWLGVCLIEMPRGRTAWDFTSPSEAADSWAYEHEKTIGDLAASLWGIESDSGADYLDEVARELVSEAR